MLKPFMIPGIMEPGCDEAGRGPLAGSVFAAAVILPLPALMRDEESERMMAILNDSKQLNEQQRYMLRPWIEQHALAWAVSEVTAEEIDQINILRASILGMQRALDRIQGVAANGIVRYAGTVENIGHILVDGNKWRPYSRGCTLADGVDSECMLGAEIPANTVVKGDATYMSIAAASILAKTYRDDYMLRLHSEFPMYGWNENKGYPTQAHYRAIAEHGITPYHRKQFKLYK